MWLIMGLAPLPLKFLPLSPIFSQMNDMWQVQNLKAPNIPRQNHLFSSLNHTFLFLSATVPWKTYCHVHRHSPAIWSWWYRLNLPLPFLHLKPLVSSTSPSISILCKFLSWHNLFLSISRLALSSFTFFFKNTISPFIYSTLTFFLTNPSNPTPILPIRVSQKAQTTIFLQLQHKTLITRPSQLGLKHLIFHHKPI